MGDDSDCDHPSASDAVLSEFERLVKEQGPRLLRLVYRDLQHFHDAEDVLQTAFRNAVGAISAGKVHDSKDLRAWLLTVIRHCVINEWRRRALVKARTASGDEVTMDSVPGQLGVPQAAHVGLLEILLFVRTLPKEPQAVWFLCEIHGHTAPEVAELLGIPVGTVASRLRAARDRVRCHVTGGVERATPVPESRERSVGGESQQSQEDVPDGDLTRSAKGHEGQ